MKPAQKSRSGLSFAAKTALAVCALVVTGVWVLWRLQPWQAAVESTAKKQFAESLSGTIAWSSLVIHLPPSVTIVGLRFISLENDTLARIDTVKANIRLLPLLRRRVLIPVLSLHGVTAGWRTGSRPNLGDLFTTTPGPGSGWDVAIDRISIDSGQFVFRDSAGGVEVGVSGLSAGGTLQRTDELFMRFRALSGDARLRERTYDLDSFGVSLQTGNGQAVLDDITVRVGRHISFIGAATFPYDSLKEFSATVSAHADSHFVESFGAARWGLTRMTSARSTITVAGAIESPRLDLSLDIRDARVRSLVIDSLSLALDMSAAGEVRCRVHAVGEGTSAALSLTAELPGLYAGPSTTPYTVRGRAEIYDVVRVLPLPTRRSINSVFCAVPVQLAFTASGRSLKRIPDHAIAACSTRLAMRNTQKPAVPVTLAVRYNGGDIVIDGGSNAGLVIDGRGTYENEALDLKTTLTIDSLATLSRVLLRDTIEGRVVAAAQVRYAGSDASAVITASLSDVSWRYLVCDTASVAMVYDGAAFIIKEAHATIEGPFEEALALMGVEGVAGRVRADVTAAGPLRAPIVEGTYTVTALALGETKTLLADTITGSITFNDSVLTVSEMVIIKDSLSALGTVAMTVPVRRISGAWDISIGDRKSEFAGKCSVGVSLRGDSLLQSVFVLDSVPVRAIRFWKSSIPTVRGRTTIRGAMTGRFANPRAEVAIVVFDTGIAGAPVLTVGATLVEHSIAAQCTLLLSDSLPQLVAEGVMHLTSAWDLDTARALSAQVRVRAQSLDVNAWTRLVNAGVEAGGTLDADLSLLLHRTVWSGSGMAAISEGRLAWPDKNIVIDTIEFSMTPGGDVAGIPAARISVHTGAFTLGTTTGEAIDVSGKLSPRILVVDTALIRTAHGALRAHGAIPLLDAAKIAVSPDLRLSLTLKELNLSIVNNLVLGWHFVSGTAEGSVDVTGREDGLNVQGVLKGTKMVVAFDDFAPPAGPFDAALRMHGDNVTLERMTGTWGGGTVGGDGTLRWTSRGLSEGRIVLTVRSVLVKYAEENDIRIDTARIAIEQVDERWKIGGSVLLGKSRLVQAVALNQPDVTLVPSTADTADEGIILDVHVKSPANLYADIILGQILTGPVGRLQATCGGALTIGGTTAQPLMKGEVTVVDGTVAYLDRMFNITRGMMNFDGSAGFNPYISLTAVTSIYEALGGVFARDDSLIITLLVIGDIDGPVLSLRSAPVAYTESEIISLLTFGRASLNSSGADMLGNRASSILSQTASFYASAQGRRLLGLDQITITGDILQTDPSGEKTTITVSKRIGDAVTVTYKGLVSSSKGQRAIISWKILSFLFLDGESDIAGNAGIDLKIKVKK